LHGWLYFVRGLFPPKQQTTSSSNRPAGPFCLDCLDCSRARVLHAWKRFDQTEQSNHCFVYRPGLLCTENCTNKFRKLYKWRFTKNEKKKVSTYLGIGWKN
jgi:hypothetical protein